MHTLPPNSTATPRGWYKVSLVSNLGIPAGGAMDPSPVRTLLFPALLGVASALVSAQQLVWRSEGVAGRHSFGGYRMSTLGDLDHDGDEDVLYMGRDMGDPNGRAMVMVVSGKTGNLLRRRPLNPFDWPLLSMAAAGDLDGDGHPDYLVAAGNSPTNTIGVQACSGTDDRLLWQVNGPAHQQFGMSLLGRIDLNADGRPDVALTWPRDGTYPDWVGSVVAYDHQGNQLWKRNGTLQLRFNFEAQQTLAAVGDVNGDRCDDVVVGATDLSQASRTGAVVILSGRDGSILTIGRDPEGYQAGFLNAPASDVDGDGVPDVATVTDANVAEVFSGRTGAVVWRWGPWPYHVFDSVAGGLDLDRDGVPDVVAGVSGLQTALNENGRIYAFSGRDGSELFHFDNQVRPVPRMGRHLATIRRVADEFGTFVENAPEYRPYIFQNRFGHIGWLRAFRGAAPGAEIFAGGCDGLAVRAPRIGLVRRIPAANPNATARVHLADARGGRQAVLLIGFSEKNWLGQSLPLPLGAFGFPGCAVATSVEVTVLVRTGTTGREEGYAYVDLPAVSAQPSVDLHAQWVVVDPEPGRLGVLSDAVKWVH